MEAVSTLNNRGAAITSHGATSQKYVIFIYTAENVKYEIIPVYTDNENRTKPINTKRSVTDGLSNRYVYLLYYLYVYWL
jgi:hypothetical protein